MTAKIINLFPDGPQKPPTRTVTIEVSERVYEIWTECAGNEGMNKSTLANRALVVYDTIVHEERMGNRWAVHGPIQEKWWGGRYSRILGWLNVLTAK